MYHSSLPFPSVGWNTEAVGMGRAHRYALETSWQGLLIHRLGGGGDELEFPEANNLSKVANLAPLSPDEKLSILEKKIAGMNNYPNHWLLGDYTPDHLGGMEPILHPASASVGFPVTTVAPGPGRSATICNTWEGSLQTEV